MALLLIAAKNRKVYLSSLTIWDCRDLGIFRLASLCRLKLELRCFIDALYYEDSVQQVVGCIGSPSELVMS